MLKILVLVGGSLNYGSYIINDFQTTYTRTYGLKNGQIRNTDRYFA